MHIYNLEQWQHDHQFHQISKENERNTWKVIWLTVFMMIIEIGAGTIFGSMALLADGWHMGTHAMALGITAFTYIYARRHADDPRYTFGTGKLGVLGGFTSAVVLGVIALMIGAESLGRLISPTEIRFNEAIGVAVVGLVVNLLSAFLLQGHHHHHSHDCGHAHEEDHHHHHHEEDHNLKAAYFHVLADALTSVLAIVALMAGKYFGWVWLDPAMGIVGSLVIAKWAHGLIRETGAILLDRDVDMKMVKTICDTVEADSDNRITDFHIWKIGSDKLAAIISVVTHYPKPPEHYKSLLKSFEALVHVTVEVIPCAPEEACLPEKD
ncbi:cation transporter [Desulfonema ishimotonii]|uniref:Cation transporter n=1 Tax=Desulfonema ishimotonii TaxID=45657 RepID=A0A401FVQ8_9BACT|nr:CDF family Co(II)/Ni(II) efflux transporter DmeF [Desulfonema ishimotonii]GBC61051.1 cation transporter [Desulfonema ishimotonii]